FTITDRGSPVNDTILHRAAERNLPDLITMAVGEFGAQCNLRNGFGDTPISIANREGRERARSALNNVCQ
ncbi:MAG: ankyrin repeat domain-containing protein, partial [Flammeovirgaceae bacterium]